MATTALTLDNFEQAVSGEGITLVDFWAEWCGPCKQFGPIFEAAAEENPDITFGKVDTEAEQQIAGALEIMSIPTIMIFRDGVQLFSQPGAVPEVRARRSDPPGAGSRHGQDPCRDRRAGGAATRRRARCGVRLIPNDPRPPVTPRAGSLHDLMERFGLVGLPNAGKSSLYNALTGGGALAAPYPFATKDPNIGVAKVPDDRLDRLAEMSKSKNVVHASVEVVDIGGLVEGASKGEGLGNKFLANIREVDAIVFVLRAFEDDDVTGSSDPLEHLRVVELELALWPTSKRSRSDWRKWNEPPNSIARSATSSMRCGQPTKRCQTGCRSIAPA